MRSAPLPLLAPAVGFLATALLAGVARAQDWATPAEGESAPPTEEPRPVAPARPGDAVAVPLEVELAGEAAFLTAPIRGGTNPFGAGFGGRAGLAYGGLYIGVSALDFLGGDDVDVSYRAILYGVEAGYGVRLGLAPGATLTLRPLVGVGDASVSYTDPALAADVVTSASSAAGSNTLTVNNVYVEPAFMVMLRRGNLLAAVRASTLVVPGIEYGGAAATTWVSYGAQFQLGVGF